MIIAQITDLHVVSNGQLCQGRVATNAQLQEAVAHINRLDPRPDVVLATGDLTDHGTPEEYEALREILPVLIPPLYLIPGNHDNRDVLLDAFPDHDYLPRPGALFAHYVIDEYPVRLVGLDTTMPGQHYGVLCEDRLAWLDNTLRAASNRPTLIFMHHAPFRTGIRWMDAIGLHGGRKMEEIVANHNQVEWVACGHLHRPIQLVWGGTIACTASSISHAQVALTLTEIRGFDFEFVIEPRAVQLYVRDAGYGFLSHVSYVPATHETFVHANMTHFRELFQRGYEKLCHTEFDAVSSARSHRTNE